MDAVAAPQSKVTAKVIDALYVEAMVLADDARAYFDTFSREDRDALGPVLRVAFSCESLKVTTRLMHIIAWPVLARIIEKGTDRHIHAVTKLVQVGHRFRPQAIAPGAEHRRRLAR